MTEFLIHCEDPSHEGRRAKVAEFSSEHSAWGLRLGNPGLDAREAIEPRRQVRGAKKPGDLRNEDIVWRYRLECPLCGLTATATESKLNSLLDALAEAGVSSISLGALAARLSSK